MNLVSRPIRFIKQTMHSTEKNSGRLLNSSASRILQRKRKGLWPPIESLSLNNLAHLISRELSLAEIISNVLRHDGPIWLRFQESMAYIVDETRKRA
ncbi:hypothetical protein HZH66_012912 [Vespula vulgaris]|uniref:Uncharacterized protein n=1 Tax=Vespula vulgaris TaxID=7454 RepID=A0A834JAE2_VESVU|nr:hypothetical protein HZH66_012912 [Vespula vulgaris]